ncbi:TetR family transcriptional regulator [Limnobacter thiooxidans]|uniref:TetR/AcrR family transcriptional regulator n=1 Tax=Limnobacter thiooxidans TaxID=131080 RepID=A0AA86MD67_9BURK|nr:TetR family transcriptional regulator [Limnobacter thiooxidans]BET25661.1 TetR/AcrR family transcriptional regulator [Limnobacter thiooxidans]
MRKIPQQQRSKALVSRLVEATAQAIREHGMDKFTTHHVAELAGVSVGSLYQYFDSREDLVEALLQDVTDSLRQGLNTLVLEKTTELRDMVERSVRYGMAFLRADDGLAVELVRNWYRLPTQNVARLLQDTLLDFMRMYLLKNPLGNNPQRLQIRSFVIANSIVFTMIRAISEPSPFITDEELALELIEMVISYLNA